MKKDVIYIDVEDDITAIIGKIKNAKENIVALVPPRRVGVLQSVVNLKLLKKAGDAANKRIVLITGDQALSALTAGLGIPIAHDLQSRPEIVPANESLKNESEVIEGEVRTPKKDDESPKPVTPNKADAASKAAGLTAADDVIGDRKPASKQPTKSKGHGGIKIPNFEKFRKWIILGAAGLVVLIIFLVWAFAYAPHATITIQAAASAKNGSFAVNLDQNNSTNATSREIQPIVRQDQTTLSKTFNGTGSKTIGTPATGTITVYQCEDQSPNTFSLGSGSVFSVNGLDYTTTQSYTIPGYTGPSSGCSPSPGGHAGTLSGVSVQATALGTNYNMSSAQDFVFNGDPNGTYVVGYGQASGGTTPQTVTIIQQSDLNTAIAALESQSDSSVESQLAGEFDANTWVLKDSFIAKYGTPTSSPAVGQQASNATVTIPVTYYMLGMSNTDINAVLTSYFNSLITNKSQQGVINNGFSHLSVSVTGKPSSSNPTTATAQFTATGYIGPHIDIAQLAKELQGDKEGQVQATVTALPGVKSVQVHYSPFWVTQVPKPSKTSIKLQVAHG
ncbi:MAG TPA: hypothetical protein VGS28_03205 [Candidatus Saccharimonadales bacterium]|nr:hypothetical protein [Candidatus Saccharimonadales bacterium]